MKLYHYTSVNTLYYILKNKTIRFNRLDKVDDIDEGELLYGECNIKLGQYTFVSCWTKEKQENICLWNMYNRMKEVRIAMDSDMFLLNNIKGIDPIYKQLGEDDYLVKREDMIGYDYFVLPLYGKDQFYNVQYEDDPSIFTKDVITRTNNKTYIDYTLVGVYKKSFWHIQNECRFRIIACPIDRKIPKNAGDALLYPLYANKAISKDFFDISIKDSAFNNIEIMLAPKISELDKYLIKKLVNDFCPTAKIINSTLNIREHK